MPTIYDIAKKVKDGEPIYLFDVRKSKEYEDFHINGSVNVPFDEIADILYMVPDKSAPIYIFCGSGQFSKCAVTVLEYKGYKNVYDLGAME